MQSICLIYTSWPDSADAREAARRLVDERLCACANILPGMTSVYRWQGAVEEASECVALFKTTRHAVPALIERLAALHPYDEPAILGLPVDADISAPGFLDWVAGQTRRTD